MASATKNNLFIVPIITLCVGFLPFFILSIYFKVFWINSIFDSPLIYNVSVLLGDSILLPTINYKIIDLFLNFIGFEKIKQNKKLFIIWFLIAIIISLISNITAHLVWVNDLLTDFMGFEKGEFSIIGYWHLVYSILQMQLLLMFPLLWFISIKEKIASGIKYSYHIWKFVLLFSTLAILDMLSKYLFIYENKPFIYALQIDKFAFTTTIASIIIYLIMRYFEKRK